MVMKTTLKWIERTLWVVGAVLAVWCAIVLVQARFYAHMAIPRTAATRTATPLPGDSGSAGSAAAVPEHVAPGTVLARLEAPSVHLSATVLEGTDDATLAKGAGHIEDTPFPGQDGNVGIAGHRDTTFRPVRNLKVGDTLTLELKPDAMVTVRCGDVSMTEGRMGRVGDRVAVRVAKPLRRPRTTFAMFENADGSNTGIEPP